MRAVDIGIGHDDDLVIAELLEVELVADARAERRDDGLELVVAVDLVGARLFDVQHLAPEGEDGLEARVASLRGRAACGVALDDVNFGQRRVGVVAVAQLIRHLAGLEAGLAADGFARLARGLARAVGHHGLVQNRLRDGGIFLKELRQLLASRCCSTSVRMEALPSLAFVWPSNCASVSLTEMMAVRPSRHVLAGDLVVALDIAFLDLP